MISHLLPHLLLLLAISPLLAGIIARTKAVIAGRRGSPLLQLYFDLWKLFHKEMVISSTTTWVFRVGPVAGFAIPLIASLFIPFGGMRAPITFNGDIILFVYLLALARFFTVLAALDTGSSFEGMGAARETTFSCLAEPTIFIVFIVLARISGSLALDPMLASLQSKVGHPAAGVPLLLAAVCLFVVILAENSRIPFDDPNTHLELTMIHEVMVLDHSGPDLALILYGAAMKLFIMGALLVSFILPLHPTDPFIETAAFIGAMLLLAVIVGLVESSMARLKLIRVPQLLVGTSLLSCFALILLLR